MPLHAIVTWLSRKAMVIQGNFANVRYSHYYRNPKEFFEVLRKVDISRGTYYSRLKKYGIKAEFFMSVDDGELFPIKCKSSK